MGHRASQLSDREREVLRLLGQGHDAKSSAGALGLSVHSVNEQLRSARRKLGVSSSREAARILLASENGTPKFLGSEKFGIAAQPVAGAHEGVREERRSGASARLWVLAGGSIMLALIGLVAALGFSGTPQADPLAADAATPQGKLVTLPVPKVISTSPNSDAVIAPGAFTLSVSYDQPMQDRSYSFVQTSAETFPKCDSSPQLSADRRTITLRCTAQPGQKYEIWFNRPPFMNFKSEAGVPAAPSRLVFRAAAR